MTDTAADNPTAAPTGEPDKRDRDQWLLLAAITLADMDAAETFWRQHVPRSRQGMLALEGWRWDAAAQAYVSRTGQMVGGASLRRQADQLADEMEYEMRAEAQRVAVGEIAIDEWQRRQAEDTKDLYVAIAMLAAGGRRNLTDELKRRVEGGPDKSPSITYSLNCLYEFGQNVRNGDRNAGSEDMIAFRAGLYSAASRGIFEDVKRESHRNARDPKGRRLYLYEKNSLMPGENCSDSDEAPGCIEETARGWVPIGTLSLPGQRTCRVGCNCFMSYALKPDDDE